MSKPLRLSLTKVTCQVEQTLELGKDEMYLILFGITGGGQRLYVAPTGLGSYATGDVNKSTFPKTLIDATVDDGESLGAVCIWLFERDIGGLAQSGTALQTSFNASLGNYLALDAPMDLEPAALYLYAFAQSMVDMRSILQLRAYGTLNSDEVLMPRFQHLLATMPPPGIIDGFQVRTGPDGKYTLNFDLNFRLEPVVVR